MLSPPKEEQAWDACSSTSSNAGDVPSDLDAVKDIFRQFDKDKSGTIERNEIANLLHQLSPGTFNDEQMDLLFSAVDKNNDGVIQYEEFVSWLSGQPLAPSTKAKPSPRTPETKSRSLDLAEPKCHEDERLPPPQSETPTHFTFHAEKAKHRSWRPQERAKSSGSLKSKSSTKSRSSPSSKARKISSPKSERGESPKGGKKRETPKGTKRGESARGARKGETPKGAKVAGPKAKATVKKAATAKGKKAGEEEEDEEEDEEAEVDEDEDDDDDEDEDEDEDDEDEDEDEDDSEEDEEDSSSESTDEEALAVSKAARKLAWLRLMPAKEGSSKAAAELLKDLPIVDEEFPRDCEHVKLFLLNFPGGDIDGERATDGVPPEGAERAPALRWLHGALNKIDEGDKRFSLPVKWLLGNFRLWPEADDPDEEGFVELKEFAVSKLDAIGARFENDVFLALDLGAKLGSLGADVAPCRPRQDHSLPLPLSSAFHHAPAEFEKLNMDDYERAYMAYLLTAVHAMDHHYQAAARKVCEAAGGECKAPAPKGFMRMMAKMITDHKEALHPRPAENIDTNRVAMTFEEPEQLAEAFKGAAKAFGEPLRVKNGYSPAFNALEISKGYRNILANHRYEPEGVTWGKLAKMPEVHEAWDKLRSSMLETFLRMNFVGSEALLDTEYQNILLDLDASRTFLASKEMRDEPAVLIVEVQYMLRPYMGMRKYTHSWYKIVRAENAEGLVSDYSA